ncbi:MAG: twin-arginine translocation signal domain-containing protein, partial [Methylorubrum rhodinum]|uniref:twin-arginine translocation signal domain-containing protein n=1 Tax=Methylorubrum rhodinum TaxID=29428 RepID=UPI003BB0ACEA
MPSPIPSRRQVLGQLAALPIALPVAALLSRPAVTESSPAAEALLLNDAGGFSPTRVARHVTISTDPVEA